MVRAVCQQCPSLTEMVKGIYGPVPAFLLVLLSFSGRELVRFGLHCSSAQTLKNSPSCFVLSSDRKQAEVRGPAPTATDRLWYVCVIGKARSLWATAAAKMKCVKAASLHVFPLD